MVDLHEKSIYNSLSLQARRDIWIPQLVFHNTDIKKETLNDEKAFATVDRQGSYERRGPTYLHNAYLYRGRENPITLSRVYSDRFICEYDMSVYPFDRQTCVAIFVMKGDAGQFIKLMANSSAYLGPIDLPQYFVWENKIREITVPPNTNAVQVEIVFGRRLLSTVLTNYVPTFLICVMSLCTNYFKSYFFEAMVTVNLTSLLALTTLFVSISNSLPKTSYVKMIDSWLLFCLFIPFCEVIMQVYRMRFAANYI